MIKMLFTEAPENTIPDCSTATCEQLCSIVNGQVSCDCRRGYILRNDQRSCGGKHINSYFYNYDGSIVN